MKILRNSATCLVCSETLESEDRHVPVRCSCGNVTIYGGNDYLRHVVRRYDRYENTSIVEKSEGFPAVHFRGDGFTRTSA